MEKETKRWQHSLAVKLFNEAQVLIVSLDGIHLAINNSETTRRFFSGSNMKKKTSDKIMKIIEEEFVQLPENPTIHYGKIYIRKSLIWELSGMKKALIQFDENMKEFDRKNEETRIKNALEDYIELNEE